MQGKGRGKPLPRDWGIGDWRICERRCPLNHLSPRGLVGFVVGGLVPGPWSQVPGPWSLALVPGPWSLVPGPWSLAPGPWPLVPGPWSLVPGPWSLVPGPWSRALGPVIVRPYSYESATL